MRYSEFESEFSSFLASVKPGTRRVWKQRDNVPLSAVTEARQSVTSVVPVTVQSVTGGVTEQKTLQASVTKPKDVTGALQVALQSAEAGHPEFDIMEDGLARGFPGDTWQRVNRTCHALRRMAERKCGGITEDATKMARALIVRWEKNPTLDELKKIDSETAGGK